MERTLSLEEEGEMRVVDESSSSFCLICDSRLNIASGLNIFYTSLPRNGELLASFVLRVLRPAATDLCSSYICLRCYDLFRTLEQAQWTASSVKCEILKFYRGKNPAKDDEFIIPEIYVDSKAILENDRFEEIQGLRPLDEEVEKNLVTSEANIGVDRGGAIMTNFDPLNVEINDSAGSSGINETCDLGNLVPASENDYRASMDLIESQDPDEKLDESTTKDSSKNPRSIVLASSEQEFSKNLQSSIDVKAEFRENFSTTEPENSEEYDVTKLSEGGSWKSGRISKYSQKPLKYSCTTCEKKWRTSAELRTHVKSHSSIRPYMCEKCGQAYKHKHALEIHVGMHNGVSPFRCNVCNKCFTQKGALMRHLPMHTGETPYQCELCGKRFVHHTSYNMHALSHTGKKSYQCHVCDLSLLSTSHLKRHMRVHTGEKPYSCSLCGKSFAERYNLFAHQKIHDPAEIMAKAAKKMQFKCERCDEHFDKKQKLEEHASEHESKETTGDQQKWLGHTIDVAEPRNVNFSTTNDDNADESWREIDYSKFTNSQGEPRLEQSDNQISQESINTLVPQGNYGGTLIIQEPPNLGNIGKID